MLTGQPVEEVARLHVDQWDAKERIIDWSKTKNGKPHAIPVPEIAVELIASIKPNAHGWFFPSAMDPTRPVSHGTLYSFMWRQREREVIPVVTNRDLLRTWKTLAGQAGLSKEIRDRIQNHTLQDVSSKSYDRWNYMPEKRAAMKSRVVCTHFYAMTRRFSPWFERTLQECATRYRSHRLLPLCAKRSDIRPD